MVDEAVASVELWDAILAFELLISRYKPPFFFSFFLSIRQTSIATHNRFFQYPLGINKNDRVLLPHRPLAALDNVGKPKTRLTDGGNPPH